MSNKLRTHVTTDAPTDDKLAPKHLTKQQFGKRLYKLMLANGWHQSELSRRSGVSRDNISGYIRGRTLPTPVNLQKLADALGVRPQEMLPNYVENAIEQDAPAFEIKTSTSAPNMAWLRVNRLVSLPTALKIGELLGDDEPLDRSGSGSTPAV